MQPFFEHADFLRRLAGQLAGAGGADDLLQDTWVATQRSPAPPAHRLRAWLGTVATNLWRNGHRAATRRRAREQRAGAAAEDSVPAVVDIVAGEEVRRRVVAAVLALPVPLREVVLLRYYEGLDASAIAGRLQRPASTVRTQLQTALSQLRAQLDAEHGGDRAAWAVPLISLVRSFPAVGVARSSAAIRMAAALFVGAVALWVAWPGGSEAPSLLAPKSTNPTTAAVATPGALGNAAPERQEAATSTPATAVQSDSVVYREDLPVAALDGIVVDETSGLPIAAANVRIRPVADGLSDITGLPAVAGGERALLGDADGAFHCASLPAGLYELEGEGPGGERGRTRVAVGAVKTDAVLRLKLQPYVGLALIKVVDAARTAVAGARVELAATCSRRGAIGYRGVPPIVGVTDDRGLFRLADARRLETIGECLVVATAPDGRCGTFEGGQVVHPGHNPWFEVVVGVAGAIEGRLSGPCNDWSAARVRAQPAWGYDSVREGAAMDGTAQIVTADGTFRIGGLAAGRYHLQVTGVEPLVRVVPEITEGSQFLPIVAVAAGATSPATIEFIAGGQLQGVVRDEAGALLAGVSVRACKTTSEQVAIYWHEGSTSAPAPYGDLVTTTDADGRYVLTVSPGLWHLLATAPGRTLALQLGLEVAADATVVQDLQLVADGALRGRTTGSQVLLRLRTKDGGHGPMQGIGADAGAFSVRGLQPGTWEVGAPGDDGVVPLAEVVVRARETTWVDVRTMVANTLSGLVSIDGRPAPDIEVVVPDGSARCRTAHDGTFVLALPPFASRLAPVYFAQRGVAFGRTVAELAAGGTTQLGRIELAPQRVSLRCLDGAGKPVAASVRSHATPGGSGPVWIPMPEGTLHDLLLDAHEKSFDVVFADGEEQQVSVVAGMAMPVVVRQQPTGAVRVHLIDRDGVSRPNVPIGIEPWGRVGAAPSDPATFHAQRAASTRNVQRTDAAGTVLVRGVPEGPVLVYVTDGWGSLRYGAEVPLSQLPPADRIGSVRAGEEVAIDLVLRH